MLNGSFIAIYPRTTVPLTLRGFFLTADAVRVQTRNECAFVSTDLHLAWLLLPLAADSIAARLFRFFLCRSRNRRLRLALAWRDACPVRLAVTFARNAIGVTGGLSTVSAVVFRSFPSLL